MYKIPSIKKGYNDGKNNMYTNICSMKYSLGADWELAFGSLEWLKYSSQIYVSKKNPTIGLKIYSKDDVDVYSSLDDVLFISDLQRVQKKIKYTDFPLGVIYKDGLIIGQIIPFYKDYVNLNMLKVDDELVMLKIYQDILKNLEELYDNGIVYIDIHDMNILIGKDGFLPKLIDFDKRFVKFDMTLNCYINSMFNNFSKLLNDSNSKRGIYDEIGQFKSVSSFVDANMQIEEMKRKLLRK